MLLGGEGEVGRLQLQGRQRNDPVVADPLQSLVDTVRAELFRPNDQLIEALVVPQVELPAQYDVAAIDVGKLGELPEFPLALAGLVR